ncbi:hypothetical protein E2C01_076917 [Portunus trituberculatus]|uniref:Uncharacterized protein n=1 Tax=Portunus trituberculatus TaxID=210409 RepID=A0A5B7IEE6_PORTR|nr:hypothetical protein [Portunus trituberculatus]
MNAAQGDTPAWDRREAERRGADGHKRLTKTEAQDAHGREEIDDEHRLRRPRVTRRGHLREEGEGASKGRAG